MTRLEAVRLIGQTISIHAAPTSYPVEESSIVSLLANVKRKKAFF